MNLTFERARRAAREFGDKVELEEIRTFDRQTFMDWGIADALYIDGQKMRTGPPPTFEGIKKKISKRVKKLKP
jgi:hypothetical protein